MKLWLIIEYSTTADWTLNSNQCSTAATTNWFEPTQKQDAVSFDLSLKLWHHSFREYWAFNSNLRYCWKNRNVGISWQHKAFHVFSSMLTLNNLIRLSNHRVCPGFSSSFSSWQAAKDMFCVVCVWLRAACACERPGWMWCLYLLSTHSCCRLYEQECSLNSPRPFPAFHSCAWVALLQQQTWGCWRDASFTLTCIHGLV